MHYKEMQRHDVSKHYKRPELCVIEGEACGHVIPEQAAKIQNFKGACPFCGQVQVWHVHESQFYYPE
ncbi:hypothetical protein ANME2D_03411 [Candidatus Methanoperedens nitroreducens]|uniref:Uncharacterized protein n=1 Tax=Candidatus Methanoperedens nitratireducens TaxID=1392998 RepID=A0A062V4F5_9EURY|nr:hypothetical protein ANME2D_03411 [Candidatus Methanoperedens nitroreducens]